ncbi:MAG: c-type cytochrome [Paucibacter sp.]|nr:c-type cytochrome [Roseateles sp.]
MLRLALVLLLLLLNVSCGGGSARAPVSPLSPQAALGARIFEDRTLSGSGRMSCATCHDPAFSHGPPNAQPVQVGGAFEQLFGLRAAPSIRYLERQPPFDAVRLRGGLMLDGRADTLAAQALLPLFGARELDAGDAETVARKVHQGVYASEFKAVYGESDAATTVQQIAEALQAFQLEDPRFHPYDSKYDAVLAGHERLSAAEARGLQAFEDPKRGNCASCHTSRPGADGKPPLFTDFGYAAVGVARNAAIPANANPQSFDLGLCQRPELAARTELCGLFRTPSLRNIARRPVYFHNGKMTSLAQVLDFYASRDSESARWYPAEKFDDLPAAYRSNVIPLAPGLSAQDLHDVACFLATLNDGYARGRPPVEACR